MARSPMLPSGMHTPWAGSDRYKDFGAQYHSQPDGHARSVHPRVLSVYASTLDFGGVSGYHPLCRPYTNAATLDTEPLARSYSGGVHTRLSSNHFQSARATDCSDERGFMDDVTVEFEFDMDKFMSRVTGELKLLSAKHAAEVTERTESLFRCFLAELRGNSSCPVCK